MTQALDAAIEAAQERYDAGDDDDVAIPAALRAALPADPPEDVIDAAIEAAAEIPGVWDRKEFDIAETAARATYRALRAHLLGEDEQGEDA